MADINKEASWVTARLMEVSNATQDGTNILITNANIQNFTPTDVVRTSAQTLTDAEQAQVRTNIGAASQADIAGVQSDIADLSDEKMDKLPEGSVAGNIPLIDNNQSIADSGFSISDLMPIKSASGRLIKIYDGAEDLPLKSAVLHINPRKFNSVVYPHERGVFNVRQNLLITGDDLKAQIKAYMPQCSIDEDAKTITITPGYSVNGPIGYIDNAQYDDGTSDVTVILTGHKSSGTNASTPFRLQYGNGVSTANYADLTAPVTTKQTQIVAFKRSNITAFTKTNRGSQSYVLYYDESYIVDGEINSVAQVPEYVGEKIIRNYPVDVYAGEFNLLTGELAVCPTIESYNGETLTGEWFSSLDDYAEGTLPSTGAFVVDLAGEKTTYQIDPVNLHTLKGYNRIWADFTFYGYSNELEIEYCCDPVLAIVESIKAVKATIAYVQDDFTAVQSYEVNDIVYVGNTLYIVTSAIAQGATMTPNTNCMETTLNAVIKSLR